MSGSPGGPGTVRSSVVTRGFVDHLGGARAGSSPGPAARRCRGSSRARRAGRRGPPRAGRATRGRWGDGTRRHATTLTPLAGCGYGHRKGFVARRDDPSSRGQATHDHGGDERRPGPTLHRRGLEPGARRRPGRGLRPGLHRRVRRRRRLQGGHPVPPYSSPTCTSPSRTSSPTTGPSPTAGPRAGRTSATWTASPPPADRWSSPASRWCTSGTDASSATTARAASPTSRTSSRARPAVVRTCGRPASGESPSPSAGLSSGARSPWSGALPRTSRCGRALVPPSPDVAVRALPGRRVPRRAR